MVRQAQPRTLVLVQAVVKPQVIMTMAIHKVEDQAPVGTAAGTTMRACPVSYRDPRQTETAANTMRASAASHRYLRRLGAAPAILPAMVPVLFQMLLATGVTSPAHRQVAIITLVVLPAVLKVQEAIHLVLVATRLAQQLAQQATVSLANLMVVQ